jgi:hypothetical protein
VAGRFPAQRRTAPLHLLDDVPVPHGSAKELDAERRERLLEAEVRHDRADDGRGLPPLADRLEGPEVEEVVAIEEPPFRVRRDDPIGVSVEGDPEIGPGFRVARPLRRVERAAPSLMFRPSGEVASGTTRAPAARKAAGATSKAAPFAASTITVRPSRRTGSVSTRCST